MKEQCRGHLPVPKAPKSRRKECCIMQNKLDKAVKRLLDIVFFAGIIVWAAMPMLLKYLLGIYGRIAPYASQADGSRTAAAYIPVLMSLMPAGLLALLILRELRRMMATVLADNCFVEENVKSLKNMGTYAFIISAILLVRIFFFFTLTGLTVSAVFLFAGLFSRVLAAVFSKAVAYKLENDLTI